MRQRHETWTLYNATVEISGDPVEVFDEVDVEVLIERNPPHQLPAEDTSGTLRFRFTPPEDIFYNDEGVPRQLDVVAETQYEKVEFESLIVTTEMSREMEFVTLEADKEELMEKPDTDLAKTIEKHWPPARLLVKCETCGEVLFDTDEGWPAMDSGSYMATLIKTLAGKHDADEGHRSIDVAIDKQPAPVRDVDCTITVNG